MSNVSPKRKADNSRNPINPPATRYSASQRYKQELGWAPYAADHEDANCQFEINWKFADALTTCDRQIFFKWMVKIVAEEHGRLATFMPKPFANLTGNGSHCHLSLADAATR